MSDEQDEFDLDRDKDRQKKFIEKLSDYDAAFPCQLEYNLSILGKSMVTQMGMSKREVIAAHALQGLLSNEKIANMEYAARKAIEAADALINKLNEEVKND